MEKFYLAPLKINKGKYLLSKIEIGVIFAEGGRGRVTVIDPRDDKLREDLIKSREDWTELSRDKADYLIKIDKEKRIDNHKKGLFEKIKQLKINEECLINKERFTVKNIDGEKYTFLKKDGGERTKTMTMTEIDSLENVEYYLCIKSYGRIKEGTIIVKEGGERKEYPGGGCVGNIGEDRVSKTTRGEAVFMKEVPLEQRVEMHEDKLWEKIDKLKVNDECCLRDDRDRTAYRIIMINAEHDGVKYSLKSARGGLKKEVNQRDIVPVVKKREAEIKEECKISLFVKCQDFNLTIIDPLLIKKIDEVNELKIMERMLVIKGTKHTARVRWKGLVNEFISIGCEMDEDFDRGYDAKYKGKELFKTCKNKGVIMPVKIEEIYQTCEREHDQCHGGLRKTKDNVLEEESICCIKEETMKSEDKGRDIVIRDNIRGRYMWRGEVNGEKCVGVDLDKSPTIRGYNYEGLIKKVRLFEYASLKGAIFAEQDICRSLHCANNNVDFVNPTNIKSFNRGKSFAKMLMLKQNNNSLVVRLRWKGGVDGRLCLGCELAKDCEYGGAGILRDGGVFKSEGKRGVLIEVDEGVTCCEGGETRHKEVETRSNKTIEDVCICCVERGESLGGEDQRVNEEVILRKGLAGTMKWRGRINGEECIGVELERSVNEGSDGSFRGLRLFQCGSKKGVLMKRADITDTLRCDIINMDVVNHTNIEIKTSFKEQSLFLVLRDNNKSQLLEVRGMVNVVQRECLGCVLPQTHQYGTDGSFGGSRLFECDNNKGVLIYREDLDCLKDNSKHKEIKVAVNSYIKEDNICCINKGVKKSPDKIVKVKINDHKIFGKALWTGCINGVNVLGLDLDIPGESGTDGTFCGVNLFQCIKGKGYLYLRSVVDEVKRIEFIKDIYLKNNCDIRDIERGRADMEGRLVSVEGDPRVFGKVKFCVTIMEESLKAVKINDDYAARYCDFIKDKVFSKNVVGEENVIIVKSKYAKLFKEDLKFKEYKDDNLSVGDEVEFQLIINLQKFTGNIVMIIEANDVPSAIVELDVFSVEDYISAFICLQNVFNEVNLTISSKTAIVPLNCLRKLGDEKKCLNLIFDFIKNKEVGVNILVELLRKSNTRFVKNLIKEWNHPINLECYPDLLSKLINDGEYDIISILFNHFVFSEENNFHILKIIKYFLFRKDFSLFNAACKKCINVNVIMDDGETFLTNVIKESDDEDIICRVIGTNIFDINKTNQDGESPLMLVCRKLMLSCVRLLMSNGVNISYQNNIALNIVIDQENNETNVTQLSKIIQITKELTKKVRLETNVCSICENEPRNCVLNCGHRFCKTCAEKVIDCFLCRKQITNRIQFYE